MRIKIYFILFVILLVQCNTQTHDKFIDEQPISSQNFLKKRFYKYNTENIGTIYYQYKTNDRENPIPFKPIIYTNVERNPNISNSPRSLFSPSKEEKNYEYFENKLNGEYVLYMEKEGRITMREYARWYDFDKDRHTKDSIKVLSSKLDTEDKVFDYLKRNNIKYKLINIKKYSPGAEIKILLDANKSYVYITISPYYVISNMYYQAQDTLYLNNNFGRGLFKY